MDRRRFIRNSGFAVAAITTLSSFDDQPSPSTILPSKLKSGDNVAVIAPGGAVFNHNYITSIQKSLIQLGLNPVIGNSCTTQYGQFSGSDETRANELMSYFKNPEIKAIITMRGGSGCARILPLLDYYTIRKNPTILMGFSDITSLLVGIYSKTGLITYHGPVGYSTWNEFSVNALKKVLFEGKPHHILNNTETNRWILKEGKAEGKLFGGNLTVLCSLLGTEYFPKFNNGILILEEIDEEPYAIDRMLTQLKLAGVLNNINGILLGDFKRCVPEEPDKSFSLKETLIQNLDPLGIPVLVGGDFGHTLNKWTLPIGLRVSINSSNFKVELLDQSVN